MATKHVWSAIIVISAIIIISAISELVFCWMMLMSSLRSTLLSVNPGVWTICVRCMKDGLHGCDVISMEAVVNMCMIHFSRRS